MREVTRKMIILLEKRKRKLEEKKQVNEMSEIIYETMMKEMKNRIEKGKRLYKNREAS